MSLPEIEASAGTRYRANVRRFYLLRLVANLQLWAPIWVVFLQQERGLSLAEIGLLETPLQIASILSAMPGGALADRFGRKPVLILGSLCFALAVFIFGVGPTLGWLLLSQLAFGISFTLAFNGPDRAFLHDSLAASGAEAEFGRVFGRAQACMLAAFLIGGLAGAPVAAITNLQFPILVSAAISAFAVLIALSFHEPPRTEQSERLPYLQIMRDAARYAAHHPPLRTMIVLNALLLGIAYPGQLFIQPFLSEHHVSVALFGLITTPVGIASVGASLLPHQLVRRFGERRIFVLLGGALLVSLLLLGLLRSLAAFVAFLVLSFVFAAVQPLAGDYINRHSPDELRATVASVSAMADSVVFATVAPLLGLLTDRTSLETMFLLTGCAGGLVSALALFAWLRADARLAPSGKPALEPD